VDTLFWQRVTIKEVGGWGEELLKVLVAGNATGSGENEESVMNGVYNIL
jgi:hypothetical protein